MNILYSHTSFEGERTFYVVYIKRQNKCPVNSHVLNIKICLFTRDTKNVPLSRKLVYEHIMSICTCAFLFQNIPMYRTFLTITSSMYFVKFIYPSAGDW
jgi:hypothetical protein